MIQTCIWIIALPILAFIIQVFFGKKLPRQGDFISILAIIGSVVLSIPIFFDFLNSHEIFLTEKFKWISLPLFIITPTNTESFSFNIYVGILIDNYTCIMLMMVSLVCALIHIYSVGYMKGEKRYHLFFAYISLFSGAMLGLVTADNLFTFFIFWEIMGLCSYLLIGFYIEKPSANHASLKAFMTTRIGDVCFLLGIAGVIYLFGTLNFYEIYSYLKMPSITSRTILGFPALSFIGLMFLIGAIGKSAQFPLHVWLPDAMEGPTPVSALIHAATMVAAGVFLLIRVFPLLQIAPYVLVITLYIGAITAILAALIALVQFDIKKILAYSTISQLGYMVMAVGVGSFGASLFHLLTHAVFKACLFLCSGSVIHAVHTNDIREMGGLRKKLPITFPTMLIATLSISGLPFFSGFVTKDRILADVLGYGLHHSRWLIPLIAFIGAFLTAFYMFRLIYLTFFGEPRNESKFSHAHEPGVSMIIPLIILASFSFSLWYSGLTGIKAIDSSFSTQWFDLGLEKMRFSTPILEHESSIHNTALILSLTLSILGILFSTLIYLKNKLSSFQIRQKFPTFYYLLSRKFFFDELYIEIIIKKLFLPFTQLIARFDDFVIDRIIVDGWKDILMFIKSCVGHFDNIFVDKIAVDGTAYLTSFFGIIINKFQTGRIQVYLLWVVVAIIIFWWIFL